MGMAGGLRHLPHREGNHFTPPSPWWGDGFYDALFETLSQKLLGALSLEGEGWGEGEKQWFTPSSKLSPPSEEGFCDSLREKGGGSLPIGETTAWTQDVRALGRAKSE